MVGEKQTDTISGFGSEKSLFQVLAAKSPGGFEYSLEPQFDYLGYAVLTLK